MQVDNPLPVDCTLITLVLPFVWLAGRELAGRAVVDRRRARLLAPGLGAALWLLAVHFSARWSGSFHTGLWAGSVAVAAVGLIALGLRLRGVPVELESPAPASLWMLGTAVAATAVIAPTALAWSFHDEELFSGHTAIVASLQNDHYPPRHLTFPELEYRYHYGFDVLAAAATALLRCSPGLAIDVVTLVCWAYTWCLLWALGEELLGHGRGWLTAAITLFGGGLPFLCPSHEGSLVARVLQGCRIEAIDLNPSVISYFFQHPWALGIPLGLGAILVVMERRQAAPWRYAALTMLLAGLSLGQFVLFAALAASVPVAEILSDRSFPRRRLVGTIVVLAGTLALAWQAGGFFLPPPDGSGLGIRVHPGVTDTPAGTILWHLLTYGLLLPLGLLGLAFLRRGRLLLALLLGGGLFVVNVFRYAHSWDILKFGTVAALALSISSSAAVARVLSIRPAVLGSLLGGLLLIGSTASGLAFPILFAIDAPGIPQDLYLKRPSEAPLPADFETIKWLRRRVPPGEIVYREYSASLAYAHRGGLPQPWLDGMTSTFGFAPRRLERRARLLYYPRPPSDPDAYDAERVRWFVLGPSDRILNPIVDAWIARGRARQEREIGPLRIVRLLPRTR